LAEKGLRDAARAVEEAPAAARQTVTVPGTHRRLMQRCLALVSPYD
jgi:hypothetical protein